MTLGIVALTGNMTLSALLGQIDQAGGALEFYSPDREMQAVAYWDPLSGIGATEHTRWDLFERIGEDRIRFTRATLAPLVCGRVQVDLEQYHDRGLDYSTLKALVIDSEIDCAPHTSGETLGYEGTAVPEPGTWALILTGILGLFLRRRKRATVKPMAYWIRKDDREGDRSCIR